MSHTRRSKGRVDRDRPVQPPPRPASSSPRSRGLRWWIVGCAALGIAAILGGGWWFSGQVHSTPRPDVLLVTIDTLRADHLGSYGYRGAATPVIDALAATGARFVEVITPVPLTLPSHASILTGDTPLVHGVRDNAGFVLGPTPRTLPELFKSAGYATAAFVSGFPVHHRFGLARGFDTYDDRFPRGSDPTRPPYVERRGDETIAAVTRWLEQRAAAGDEGRPLFVWVHLFDPHAPYEPPAPFDRQFAAQPYDGEIAFSDQQVGALLEAWTRLRKDRQPIVAITGDHGEGLGEHGEPTHGLFIYDSTLRVPLLLAGPHVPAGKVVGGAVSTIDIAPTLLDLAGLPPRKEMEGRSLRAALDTGKAPLEPLYAESLFGRLGFGWSPLYGWRERGLMFVDAPVPEVYDLAADPGETRNVAAARGDDQRRMQRAVQAAVARAPEARPAALPRDAAESLRSLGYVASGSAPRPSLRDPKAFAALAVRIENAMAVERADPSKAIAEFRAALKEDPENAVARRHLAMALVAARQFDPAVTELTALLASGDDSLETLTLLGDCHRLSGRYAEALEAFNRAVSKNAAVPEAFDGLGKTLTAAGRNDEARAAFEKALATVPDDPDALEGLADLALARGDVAEAQARLANLQARDAADSRVALKHGVVLVRTGQVEQAIAVFRGVLQREPGNAEAALDLGGALAKTGRPVEAVPLFEQAVRSGAKGPVVWNSLAMARLETGDRAGAAAALRESLRARPDQANIKDLLDRVVRGQL